MHLIQGLTQVHSRVAAIMVATLLALPVKAQVTVTVDNLTASVGQEVEVPVILSGVEAGAAVSAFQLTVTSSDANVVFTGHDVTGTLVSAFTVNSNTGNGRVGGFTSSSNAFSTSGTLILIKLRADAAVSATISLDEFRLNAGNPAHTPATPTFTFDASGATGGNNAPVASNGAVSTPKNTPVTVTMSATDADSDPLTYTVVSGATYGTLGVVTGNQVLYTPTADYTGSDSFTFRANDGTTNSNTATVSITVTDTGGGNTAPTANNDSYSTQEDVLLTVTAPGVLTNDADADSDPLTVSVETSPDHGNVSLASDGSFVYIPDENYSGSDSFTYVANDGTTNSSPATVTIDITAVNDAPVAQNGTATTNVGQAVTITMVATDVEGDPLSFEILAPPVQGGLGAVSGNTVTYTPNAGFSGTDDFVFRASDGSANSNNATVTITVAGNQAPVANDDSYSVDEDDILGVAAPGFLDNDSDPDSDPLTAALLTDVQNGDLTFSATGAFTYVPDNDFFGTDSFTYEVSDGSLTSSPATVTITVNPTGNARLQVILTAPDDVVNPANVYLNGELFLLNAPFLHASPFIDRTDGTLEVAISPGGTTLGDAVATLSTTLDEDGTHVLMIGGTGSAGFSLVQIENAKESIPGSNFEATFVHASADLPTIDILFVSDDRNNPQEIPLLTNGTFGDHSPYLPNVPDHFNFATRTTGGTDIEVFRLDLTGGAGKAYTIVLSGLLADSKRATYPLNLTAYDADGNAVDGDIVTAIEPPSDIVPKTFLLRGNYPNPFNPTTNIQFDLPEPAEVGIRVTDLLGREMLRVPAQSMQAGTNLSIPIDASELASGIYIYRVEVKTVRDLHIATGTMTLIK